MKYFKENEFKMGREPCFNKMNPYLIAQLDYLRKSVGKPFVITSSFRSEKYNKTTGGSKSSQHLLGNAVDISTKGFTGKDKACLVLRALDLELSVGVSKNFIHIDCRNTGSSLWGY